MDEESLAREFEANRTHLRAVAYRIVGSVHEADDAVQEAWLRLSRAGSDGIDNLPGWLTTVVARVCLDQLRSRTARREDPLEAYAPDRTEPEVTDPAYAALLADSVGRALVVVRDSLAPAEAVAFVLHDLFAVPFDEVAVVVGRSPAATRQLASRARRRVRTAGPEGSADQRHRHELVKAFLDASRSGQFEGLLALLDPEAVVRADASTIQLGSDPRARGAAAVAETFSGRARAARFVLIDGAPGAVWTLRGIPQVIFEFTIVDGAVAAIDLLSDPDTLQAVQLTTLDGTPIAGD